MSERESAANASEDYVVIFDTTLRDGEQSPGASLTSAEKLEVARALSRLGVDVIEAGFPAASADDLLAVRSIAESVGNEEVPGRQRRPSPSICGLARAFEADIDKAWEAVRHAKYPRIHTFLATSPIHREHELRLSREQVLERIGAMVRYASARCSDVEFSPEDAGRTERDFLFEAIQAAIEAGAKTINIADTVGYTTPQEFGQLIADIRAHVPGASGIVLSVHCHNDLGLATANTLAGIYAGARQAEVTINGLGERAGNTALEEVVMTLRTRSALYGVRTGIDTTQLTRTSRLVSSRTGIVVQPNKAIVGANAFAHEAGIHQDGMLKNESTYEIMRPETVGANRTQLVLGKHSGRHALGARLRELGYAVEGEELQKTFERFKALADKKKVVTDADLEALVNVEIHQPAEYYRLDAIQVTCGMGMPTATLRLVGPQGQAMVQAAVGTGPMDAAFKAVDLVVGVPVELVEYSVHSVTSGIDALGEVTVRVKSCEPVSAKVNPQHGAGQARIFHGHAADTDVVSASVKAYLVALNRVLGAGAAKEGASFENSPHRSAV